jgi:hypothetical protein
MDTVEPPMEQPLEQPEQPMEQPLEPEQPMEQAIEQPMEQAIEQPMEQSRAKPARVRKVRVQSTTPTTAPPDPHYWRSRLEEHRNQQRASKNERYANLRFM